MRLGLVLLLLLFPVFSIAAESHWLAKDVLSGDSFMLDDGRTVRLEGIKAPSAEARDYLQALLEKQPIEIRHIMTDRYGRLTGQVYAGVPSVWVQDEMVRSGMAFVYPPTNVESDIAMMLTIESAARVSRTGLWRDPSFADIAVEDAPKHAGHFVFVVGKVRDVKNIKNTLYLHLGDDWRHDFSIMITAHDRHTFLQAGIDPESWMGKKLRMRGWIKRDPEPMMQLTSLAQIELMVDR